MRGIAVYIVCFLTAVACHVIVLRSNVSMRASLDDTVTLDITRVELSLSDNQDQTPGGTLMNDPAPAPEPIPPESYTLRDETALEPNVMPPPPEWTPTPPRLEQPKPINQIPPAPMTLPTLQVGGGESGQVDVAPTLTRPITPDYPRGARERGEKGAVRLIIQIDANGYATEVSIDQSCGFPNLDNAAKRAVFKARFNPAQKNGRPVASSATLTLFFRLKK